MSKPEAETGKEAVVDTQQADLVSPDQEGSLSDILEKSKGTAFTGHPALEEAAGPEGEKTEDRAEDGKAEEEKVKASTQEAPKFKHATWEETESARIEAERVMHQSNEEAAALKKQIADREATDQAAKDAAAVEAAQPKPEEIRAEAKAKVKTALKTIRSLDEDDPEYDEKVADAWAEAGVGGHPGTVAAAPDKEAIAKLVEEQVKNTLSAEREANAARDAATENARTRENAQDIAVKAGLKMEKGSVDYRLFWDVAKDIPAAFQDKPLADQVDWAIDEVRKLKGEVVKTKEQKAAETLRLQQQNAVLEKGPERVISKPKQEAYSLNTIVTKQTEARRI
jgi:hypothetical protein